MNSTQESPGDMKNHTEDAYSQIKDAIPSCEQILARHKKRSQRNKRQG